MAKFIQAHSPTEKNVSYYINVETVRYVAQNTQHEDRSLIRFVGDEHTLAISEAAASFVSRACAD